MDSWTDGYVSEIPYVNRFYPELTPQLIRYALRAQGFDAPASPFRYCELGSGHGLSTNVNAAANPDSQFVAVDFLTEHTQAAQALAAAAELTSIACYDDSFEQFAARDIEPFDFICLHGVYSWVNAENRQRVVDLIDKLLKPGGVVYMSYNSLPGRAPAIPLRDLMWFHQETSEGPIVDRINDAIQFASDLFKTQTGFFADNRGFERVLKAMQGENRNVLAHEYFNRDWTSFYHAQVASDLGAVGLSFAAPVSLIDQYDALTIPPAAQEQLAKVTDPTLRETVLDYLVNRQFRRDLFVRGPKRLGPDQAANMMDQRLAMTIARRDLKLRRTLARGEVQLDARVHEPIADVLAKGPMTVRELLADPGMAAVGEQLVLQALNIGIGVGYVQPALPLEGEDARRDVTNRFNRAVCGTAGRSADNQVLASPVTGGGVRVNSFDATYLGAIYDGVDPVVATWQWLKERGRRMRRGNEQLMTEQENVAYIGEKYAEFAEHKLPALKLLGLA